MNETKKDEGENLDNEQYVLILIRKFTYFFYNNLYNVKTRQDYDKNVKFKLVIIGCFYYYS